MTSIFTHKPIVGGAFGAGRYALATLPAVRQGLRVTRHLVIDPVDGRVLSVADDKQEAIATARQVLLATEHLARVEAAELERTSRQAPLWPTEAFEQPAVRERAKPVSKRRRDVYAKCSGCCHYCRTPLRLEGGWHIEHMLPRALGGLDEIGNLFAACGPCNFAKRDRTALEFFAALALEQPKDAQR